MATYSKIHAGPTEVSSYYDYGDVGLRMYSHKKQFLMTWNTMLDAIALNRCLNWTGQLSSTRTHTPISNCLQFCKWPPVNLHFDDVNFLSTNIGIAALTGDAYYRGIKQVEGDYYPPDPEDPSDVPNSREFLQTPVSCDHELLKGFDVGLSCKIYDAFPGVYSQNWYNACWHDLMAYTMAGSFDNAHKTIKVFSPLMNPELTSLYGTSDRDIGQWFYKTDTSPSEYLGSLYRLLAYRNKDFFGGCTVNAIDTDKMYQRGFNVHVSNPEKAQFIAELNDIGEFFYNLPFELSDRYLDLCSARIEDLVCCKDSFLSSQIDLPYDPSDDKETRARKLSTMLSSPSVYELAWPNRVGVDENSDNLLLDTQWELKDPFEFGSPMLNPRLLWDNFVCFSDLHRTIMLRNDRNSRQGYDVDYFSRWATLDCLWYCDHYSMSRRARVDWDASVQIVSVDWQSKYARLSGTWNSVTSYTEISDDWRLDNQICCNRNQFLSFYGEGGPLSANAEVTIKNIWFELSGDLIVLLQGLNLQQQAFARSLFPKDGEDERLREIDALSAQYMQQILLLSATIQEKQLSADSIRALINEIYAIEDLLLYLHYLAAAANHGYTIGKTPIPDPVSGDDWDELVADLETAVRNDPNVPPAQKEALIDLILGEGEDAFNEDPEVIRLEDLLSQLAASLRLVLAEITQLNQQIQDLLDELSYKIEEIKRKVMPIDLDIDKTGFYDGFDLVASIGLSVPVNFYYHAIGAAEIFSPLQLSPSMIVDDRELPTMHWPLPEYVSLFNNKCLLTDYSPWKVDYKYGEILSSATETSAVGMMPRAKIGSDADFYGKFALVQSTLPSYLSAILGDAGISFPSFAGTKPDLSLYSRRHGNVNQLVQVKPIEIGAFRADPVMEDDGIHYKTVDFEGRKGVVLNFIMRINGLRIEFKNTDLAYNNQLPTFIVPLISYLYVPSLLPSVERLKYWYGNSILLNMLGRDKTLACARVGLLSIKT